MYGISALLWKQEYIGVIFCKSLILHQIQFNSLFFLNYYINKFGPLKSTVTQEWNHLELYRFKIGTVLKKLCNSRKKYFVN